MLVLYIAEWNLWLPSNTCFAAAGGCGEGFAACAGAGAAVGAAGVCAANGGDEMGTDSEAVNLGKRNEESIILYSLQ